MIRFWWRFRRWNEQPVPDWWLTDKFIIGTAILFPVFIPFCAFMSILTAISLVVTYLFREPKVS